MEKTPKKKITVRYPREGEREKASLTFPLPPFVTQKIDFLPLQSFYRATLRIFRQVVIITQGDIFATLEAFFSTYPSFEKRVFFCTGTDQILLRRLYNELPQEDVIFLFLARRPEEFWNLLAFLALQDRRRILVGEPHGAFAECARECFVPFLSVDIPCFSFWHRSAFLYFPLSMSGIPPEEVERGFQEGYVLFRETAFRIALFVSRELAGRERVYVVIDTVLLKKLTMSFVALLEECFGKRGLFCVVSGEDLWKEKEEIPHAFIIFVQESADKKFRIRVPQTFFSPSGLFAQREFLRHCSFSDIQNAKWEVLQSLLRRMGGRFLTLELPDVSPFFVGQYMALLQYLACYGAWLRGADVFSDPPLVHFEHSIVSFLAKQHREETH